MPRVQGPLFGTSSSAEPLGRAGGAALGEDAQPRAVQGSPREYVGGEGKGSL